MARCYLGTMKDRLGPEGIQKHVKSTIQVCKNVRKHALEAGVKIASGDDYGTPFLLHGEYATELEFYVKQAGIAPLEVIRWATHHGAEAMGMPEDLGDVKVGKLADLLVVDGDPLQDIRCLQDRDNLEAILKGGAFVKGPPATSA